VATALPDQFHLDDELWVRIVYDLACAHKRMPFERGHLLRSLTPLYLGRVASFVIETREMYAAQVEDRIERLCLTFENLKPYLLASWDEKPVAASSSTAAPRSAAAREAVEARSEV
jgi:hypothetical protein